MDSTPETTDLAAALRAYVDSARQSNFEDELARIDNLLLTQPPGFADQIIVRAMAIVSKKALPVTTLIRAETALGIAYAHHDDSEALSRAVTHLLQAFTIACDVQGEHHDIEAIVRAGTELAQAHARTGHHVLAASTLETTRGHLERMSSLSEPRRSLMVELCDMTSRTLQELLDGQQY